MFPALDHESVTMHERESPLTRRTAVHPLAVLLALFVTAALPAGCEPDDSDGIDGVPVEAQQAPVHFPDKLRVEDASVNEFILEAIHTCVEGDYEAFRLLWSAKEEPLTEQEFRRGWRAVREVDIQQVRKLQTPEGEIVYAVRGLVRLDPAEVPEPNRDIVLLLVKENDQWRIARAPGSVRQMLAREQSAETKPTAEAPTTQP